MCIFTSKPALYESDFFRMGYAPDRMNRWKTLKRGLSETSVNFECHYVEKFHNFQLYEWRGTSYEAASGGRCETDVNRETGVKTVRDELTF